MIDSYKVATCTGGKDLEKILNRINDWDGEVRQILSNMTGSGLVYTVIYTLWAELKKR